MSKPKNVKNKKPEPQKLVFVEPERVTKEQKRIKVDTTRSPLNERSSRKSFLIVCEGPTEAAYFEGLCAEFDIKSHFVVKILPEKEQEKGYKGSSVKSLLYMAMQLQKKEKIPFEEVWIVFDNDEGNAFKLDDASLKRIQAIVPPSLFQKIELFQFQTMDVRVEKKVNPTNRIRYFLSRSDYQRFLEEQLEAIEVRYINDIIDKTTKREDFSNLYHTDPQVFFYDKAGEFVRFNDKGEAVYEEKFFDKTWRTYIKMAYSCIAFEYWLLLHFETRLTAFYNSREILKYFDDKAYFVEPIKNNSNSFFEKGWYLYEKRNSLIIKTFFNNLYKAILNNIYLINGQYVQSQLGTGKTHYEINPYSDVYLLAASLLNIRIGNLNALVEEYRKLKNIIVVRNQSNISITFVFQRKSTIFKREFKTLFSIINLENELILYQIEVSNTELIKEGDNVTLEISLQTVLVEPLFLVFEEIDKGISYKLVWYLGEREEI